MPDVSDTVLRISARCLFDIAVSTYKFSDKNELTFAALSASFDTLAGHSVIILEYAERTVFSVATSTLTATLLSESSLTFV